MNTVSDYRLAAYAVRNGHERPDGLTDAQYAALLLAESPDQRWRVMRGQIGHTDVRRNLREAWSWEIAEAYNGPTRPGGAVKTLFTPNGRCGYCDRRLAGGNLTFCNNDCRRYYVRRAARGGIARVCRADGCEVELGDEYSDHYCTDCQNARHTAAMVADDARWERPCETDGCDGVAVWNGKGRPPSYCVDHRTNQPAERPTACEADGCGKPLAATRTGRPRRFCSERCKKRAARSRGKTA
jgi:hypothetical protein